MNLPRFLALLLMGSAAFTLPAISQRSEEARESRPGRLILNSREILSGSRSITFERVAPPILRPTPPPTSSPGPAPTEVGLVDSSAGRTTPQVTFRLSCTVYDDAFTLIRWDFDGNRVAVWSSINFHHLVGTRGFSRDGTDYWMRFGIGDSSREVAEELNKQLRADRMPREYLVHVPEAPLKAPVGPSTYTLLPGTTMPPAAATALAALHQFYDANRDRLVDEFEAKQVREAENARLRLATPVPPPPDTTVTYFPIRSHHVPEPTAEEKR
jgi:hypothetical protein